MTEKQKGIPLVDDQSRMPIERLQKIIDETQETIRAYDIKAEILAIILTIIISVINFTLVNNFSSVSCIKYTALITILIGISSLIAAGFVLYPKKDIFKDIQTNSYTPKRTYFVNIGGTPSFNNVDVYQNEVKSPAPSLMPFAFGLRNYAIPPSIAISRGLGDFSNSQETKHETKTEVLDYNINWNIIEQHIRGRR